MTRSRSVLPAIFCAALVLSGCTSARFGDPGPGPIRAAQPAPLPEPEPVEAVPSGPVTSAPLPPVEGTAGPAAAPGTDIAALPPGQAPAPVPAPASASGGRSSIVGGWTARVAGASCRVQLSSTPALDLYRAATNGCANGDLAKVSAWDYRDGEVYLYQSGGTVAARLRSGDGALSGVLTKSGAPLTMAR